jgi:hypothetical protein
MNAIAYVHEQLTGKKDFPQFKPGDNITVNYKSSRVIRKEYSHLKEM